MQLYRYFYINDMNFDIFSSITSQGYESADECYRNLSVSHCLSRSYDLNYVRRRFDTEKKMREIFVAKNGLAVKNHPYYLVLGNCDRWFIDKKNCWGSIVFDIEEFDINSLSFTYGDSIPTFMKDFDDGKEYRGKVYTYKEILEIISKYGYPNEWNTYEEKGVENYIEVQVWCDEPISQFRGITKKNINSCIVNDFVNRLIKAKPNFDLQVVNQSTLNDAINYIKHSQLYDWMVGLFKSISKEIFCADAVHGFPHAQKCAFLAYILGCKFNLNDKLIKSLVYAAFYHDIGRRVTVLGKTHGQIGAAIFSQYIRDADVDIGMIATAICHHDSAAFNDNSLILYIVRDADSLDFIRLGMGKFKTNYLYTNHAYTLIRTAIELNLMMHVNPMFLQEVFGG